MKFDNKLIGRKQRRKIVSFVEKWCFQLGKFGHFLYVVKLCRFRIKTTIHWKYYRQNIGSKFFYLNFDIALGADIM